MAEQPIIIPVQFDTSKGIGSLAPAQGQLNQLSNTATNTGRSLGNLSGAFSNVLGGFAKGAIIGGVTTLVASLGVAILNAATNSDALEQELAELRSEADFAANAFKNAKSNIDEFKEALQFNVDFFGAGAGQADVLKLKIEQLEDSMKQIRTEKEFLDKQFETLTTSPLRFGSDKDREAIDKQIAQAIEDSQKVLKTEINTGNELLILRKKFEIQKLEDQKDANEKALKDFQDFQNKIIARARLFAKEFGNQFELPGLEETFTVSKDEVFRRSQKLLSDVASGSLKVKKQTGKIELAVKEIEIDPAEIRFKKHLDALPGIGQKDDRLSTVTGAVGLANDKITGINQNVQTTADLISGTLTPAFQGFAHSLFSNGDPIKSFFDGIISSIEQVIDKLIAAAVEALVLSALTSGGGGGFGAVFGKLLGFGGGAANLGGAGGGAQRLHVTVGGVFNGTDIYLAGQAGQRQIGRSGGF